MWALKVCSVNIMCNFNPLEKIIYIAKPIRKSLFVKDITNILFRLAYKNNSAIWTCVHILVQQSDGFST